MQRKRILAQKITKPSLKKRANKAERFENAATIESLKTSNPVKSIKKRVGAQKKGPLIKSKTVKKEVTGKPKKTIKASKQSTQMKKKLTTKSQVAKKR